MTTAATWFEIPTTQLDAAQAFYEAVLQRPMQRQSIGPNQEAFFSYDPAAGGVGGSLVMGPTATRVTSEGTVVYLNAGPSLDATLQRVAEQGGRITVPKTALPPGMGFFAKIMDLDGNQVGLHALA